MSRSNGRGSRDAPPAAAGRNTSSGREPHETGKTAHGVAVEDSAQLLRVNRDAVSEPRLAREVHSGLHHDVVFVVRAARDQYGVSR